MGYTHYWRLGDFTEEDFVRFVSDCRTIVKASPIPLAGGDGTGKPETEDRSLVSFNGCDDRSYETFYIKQNYIVLFKEFSFCKTARRPYDMIVVACLCALADRLGDAVKVTSDGERDDWKEGAEFASKVLGREVKIPGTIRK